VGIGLDYLAHPSGPRIDRGRGQSTRRHQPRHVGHHARHHLFARLYRVGAIVWGIHKTSLAHGTQRPPKVAVIVVGLAAIGFWRASQIRRAR
jgi:hypothetical protein